MNSGLKGDGDATDVNSNRDVLALQPYLEFIFKFLCQIAGDKDEMNESILSSSVGLIGDISMAFGPLIDTRLLMEAFSKEGIQVCSLKWCAYKALYSKYLGVYSYRGFHLRPHQIFRQTRNTHPPYINPVPVPSYNHLKMSK